MLKTISISVPSSLDTLYPPKAAQPLYLFRMLELGTRFSAIAADLSEKKFHEAVASFELFKTQYAEVSKLVPEWQRYYSRSPVDGLQAALKTGDPSKIMGAYERVGKVCHDCHAAYMPIVQQKYHWGDFKAVSVKDPLSKEDVDFTRLMQYLDANFAGISVSVERGDKEAAARHLQGFDARFQAMKETCKGCHDTEGRYYIDKSVQTLIDQLGQALNGSSVDPKMAEPLRQRIGMEGCIKCHWVHVPAAFAQIQSAKRK